MGEKTDKGDKGPKWNNKFNHDKDAKPCAAFNNGTAHNAFQIKGDGAAASGTCATTGSATKGRVANASVRRGAKGHARDACDNPNRSDSRLE